MFFSLDVLKEKNTPGLRHIIILPSVAARRPARHPVSRLLHLLKRHQAEVLLALCERGPALVGVKYDILDRAVYFLHDLIIKVQDVLCRELFCPGVMLIVLA